MLLQIQTQSLCNGQCPICPHPALRGTQEQGIMTQELFEKIVHQAAREPLLSCLCFTLQNEPLLDKRIFQWIKHFKALNQKKTAILTTNGELISEFSFQEIIQSQVDILAISLNAHTERTFNIINKGVEYKKVIENIDLLVSHPVMRSKVVLRFVLTKNNEKEIYDAVSFWNRKGVKTKVVDVSNRAGALENYQDYRAARVRGMILSKMKSWVGGFYENNILKQCYRPFYFMNILFNGQVIFCVNDWRRASIMGDSNQSSLRSIWNSNAMNKIRRLVLEEKYAEIVPCGQCKAAIKR